MNLLQIAIFDLFFAIFVFSFVREKKLFKNSSVAFEDENNRSCIGRGIGHPV